MRKSYQHGAGTEEDEPAAEPPVEGGITSVDYMLQAKPGEHDSLLASVFGIASIWASSDADTVAKVMHRRIGITWNETVRLTSSNPALLTDTTAYLVQSEDRRLCILCFPSADIRNAIQWFTNASSRPEPFFSSGHVHGGFFRGARILATTLGVLLESARKGGSICEAVARERAIWSRCGEEYPWNREDGARGVEGSSGTSHGALRPPRQDGPDVLEALYITGHSMGGALAVITAALLLEEPQFACLRDKLRGVYTYGQPMVGHQDFKERFERDLGKLLFRHVYRSDSVPRLPARTSGAFVHFGSLYTSKEGEGWVPSRATMGQAYTNLGAALTGITSWVLQEMLVDLPIIHRIPLRISFADHLPINYLRASEVTVTGEAFTP
ncbi:lipase family protein [Sorangium sp. So ce296]|uniref:lipase family protein n=1 Tax=Sorangium sp. So ce296 TaxID=3133296 RepID=UPI003F5E46ED